MLDNSPHWPSFLHTIAPWIGATAALLIAVVLLARFVDVLHLSIARGEALRATLAAQSTDVAPRTIRLADTGTQPQR